MPCPALTALTRDRLLPIGQVVRVCAPRFSHQFQRPLEDRQLDLRLPFLPADPLQLGAHTVALGKQPVQIRRVGIRRAIIPLPRLVWCHWIVLRYRLVQQLTLQFLTTDASTPTSAATCRDVTPPATSRATAIRLTPSATGPRLTARSRAPARRSTPPAPHGWDTPFGVWVLLRRLHASGNAPPPRASDHPCTSNNARHDWRGSPCAVPPASRDATCATPPCWIPQLPDHVRRAVLVPLVQLRRAPALLPRIPRHDDDSSPLKESNISSPPRTARPNLTKHMPGTRPATRRH